MTKNSKPSAHAVASCVVSVRFQPVDAARLTRAAGPRGRSEFVRTAALDKLARTPAAADAPAPTPDPSSGCVWVAADNDNQREKALQLRRIGGNLNQFVRAMNTLRAATQGDPDNSRTSLADKVNQYAPAADTAERLMTEIDEFLKRERSWFASIEERTAQRRDGRRVPPARFAYASS